MCGIAGIVHSGNWPVDAGLLQRMTDVMQHRGPDGRGFILLDPGRREGVFFDHALPAADRRDACTIGLGHRRLSILDLEGGQQPMANEDGTVWVVFNGEIYNFQELRKTLSRLGHCFRTDHSDTEVILHAYEEWGEDCLGHFRGMFAFGLVDLNDRRLFLARDRVGKKPLVYYATPERLVFASEIKGIVEDETIPREMELTALYENPAFARFWNKEGWDYTARMQYVDIKTYLSEDILVKVDRASMLNSLEVRNPFLDHRVIELAARIPSRLKLKGYDKKYILKKMMMPELGREFLYRKKWGFGMPLGRWFKRDLGEYLQETLLGAGSFAAAYIDPGALRGMIEQHRRGPRDLSNALWSVLFLEQWGGV